MRWIVALVIAAAVAVGAYFVLHGHADKPAPAPKVIDAAVEKPVAPVAPAAPRPPALPAEEVEAKQQADERAQIESNAAELKLKPAEVKKALAALETMQKARHQLFADLAAKKISVEEVSKQLGDLTDQMNAAFVRDLGKERGEKLIQLIRVAHGYEPASPSP